MYRSEMSSCAFFIVFLAFSALQESSATAECDGDFLFSVSGSASRTYIWSSTLYENRLTMLVVPSCIHARMDSYLVPLNLSFTIVDIPWDGYFIASGNITGSGNVEISDNHGIGTTYSSTQSEAKSFVYHLSEGMTTLRVAYTTADWHEGDGPYIGLFYAPSTTYSCANTWRQCSMTSNHQFICLPDEWRCNGREECPNGIDEYHCTGCCSSDEYAKTCYGRNNCRCDESYLDNRSRQLINGCTGKVQTMEMPTNVVSDRSSLPYWPMIIPYNITYIWRAATLPRAITITCNSMEANNSDIATFRVGDSIYDLKVLRPGMRQSVSLEGLREDVMLNIVMTSSYSVYNFSYTYTTASSSSPTITQPTSTRASGVVTPVGAAPCDHTNYVRPCMYKGLCFTKEQVCNDHMDCPNGMDEVGCGTYHHACGKDEIMCVRDLKMPSCFSPKQRCDGSQECNNGYDERDCDSTLCGTHNGTFLCTDGVCIYETWLCDKTKDCSDGADEQNCHATSLKVVTASVIGSLVCAIMIVMAVGCSCKLHTHRMYERLHQRSRYESPMSRITNELMRRTAPPPYAEAMQRSRPFEEVQSEYLAALELRQREHVTDDSEANLEEQRSVASASGTIDASEGSLVEVGEESAVSFRRNPNKPPETNLSDQDQNSRRNVNLEPKSDDETTDNSNGQRTSVASESQTSISPSRRQELRRLSIDSDVSMLSRDSEDVALLS